MNTPRVLARITNKESSVLEVVIEPWAAEYFLATSDCLEIVTRGHLPNPWVEINHQSNRMVVYLDDCDDFYARLLEDSEKGKRPGA